MLGVILFALSSIFAFGYIVRVYQKAQTKLTDLPTWDRWLNLGKNGLVVSIILILYFLPSVILFLGAILFFTVKIQILGYILLLISGVLALLTLFFVPLVLFQYSKNEKIFEAFYVFEMLKVLKGKVLAYLVNWVALIIIGLPFLIIIVLFKIFLSKGLLLDIITTVIFAFSQFLIFVIMAGLFGSFFSKSSEKTVEKETKKEIESKKKEYCHNCGTEIIKKGKFCVTCGKKL